MKNNLKKQILSFILAIVMMASMMSLTVLTAFAEELSGENIEITQQNPVLSLSPSVEPDDEVTETSTPLEEPKEDVKETPSQTTVPSVPIAEQQTQAATVAAIDLEGDEAQQSAKLNSLVIYKAKSKVPNNLIVRGETNGEKGLVFSPERTTYNLSTDEGHNYGNVDDWSSATTLYFEAIPEDGSKAFLCYGDKEEEITTTSGNYIDKQFFKAGKNTFYIEVRKEGKKTTKYTFTAYVNPSLIDNAVLADEDGRTYIEKNIQQSKNGTAAVIYVPSTWETLAVNAIASNENCILKYAIGNQNGQYTDNNVIDVTNNIKNGKDNFIVYIKAELTVGEGNEELTLVSKPYKLQITQAKDTPKKICINPDPANATVTLSRNDGKIIAQNDDGSFDVIFYQFNKNNPQDKITYTYTVSKDGYVTETGKIGSVAKDDNIVLSGESLTVNVELSKELGVQPGEVSDVDWKNFRNSDVNMAIIPVKTPTDKIGLKWNKTLGTGWGSSPSVPIIVDNKIVVMSGKKLYMLDAQSGETVKEADMVAAPNFGYTPPTYANGMIFCPLTNGTIQAFNATTMESLWVYTDTLGGQSLSPIAYSTSEVDGRTCGYIYTGFWNGESNDANYVCIDVTDYDAGNKHEPKSAEWTHTQKGGFYWAGAVVVGNALIVGTDDGGAEGSNAQSYLYSFDKITGKPISSVELAKDAGDQRSSIAYENGKIYFTTKGGYLYSAYIDINGYIDKLDGVNYNAQITSTPVVYKGKIYFGIGSGIRTDGSEGSFVVADADTLEKLFSVEMKGYPQTSALLSTAYEADGYLYFYMTYNDKPGGISLVKVKNEAKKSSDAELIEIYDAAGFEEFCIASIVCDENGHLYYKNDSGNFFAVAPATAESVDELIEKIGKVTLESESMIKAARNAYDSLTESEKANVKKYNILLEAEIALKNILKAYSVEKLIDAIGNVTMYSNIKIEIARTAYNKLSKDQKTLVTNYETLVDAEKKYEKLVDEAVEKVEDLIDAIGEVTLESGDDITAARRAYNQLPPHVQKLVKNLDKLEKAEKEFKKLREEALELIRNGKSVLTKSELLELQDKFENVTVETKYDDALSLLITYFKLGEKQQLALAGSEQLETLKTIVAKQNHENPSTAITMYGLEWNIKVNTDKLPEKDEHIKDDIISKLEGAQMLTIWDIHLEDVLTGKNHSLDDVVEVCIPVELIGDYTFYDRLGVVHYMDDGQIEVLNCKIVDGYVVFNAVDFSYYAVVGFMDAEDENETVTGNVVVDTPEYEELIEKAESVARANNNWIIWAGTAGVGIILLAVLLVLKKRMMTENK